MDVSRQGWAEATDAELLRLSSSDPEAFGVFYERHILTVLAYAQRRTASPEDAADIAAETFARAFLARRRFRDTGAPATSWLIAIARNQVRRYLRHVRVSERARRRLGLQRLELDDESMERIEALVDFEPLRQELQAALARLDRGTSEALILRVGLELPYEEVARRLGCSPVTARVRVARGLTRLADMMEGVA